ncbi:hypothetical protein BGX21_007884 [Mortierella sp. AD011]|nr:hypothetical protein BGX20_006314 [Mortierella sp. AD010]KAF9398365.1 hypothetical protein BGX21_007884 [Mortierella sp. AD011]
MALFEASIIPQFSHSTSKAIKNTTNPTKMARSLLSLLVAVLALVTFVQAAFPSGLRRIHRHGEVLTALNKAVNSPVNIIPSRGQGQASWEIIETKNRHMVHIYQVDSGLFLSPQDPQDPMPYSPLVLSPYPQEWKLVKCDRCRGEDEDMYFIELGEKVDGKIMVLGNSRIHVYPPMAGLVPKEEGSKKQLWEFDSSDDREYRSQRVFSQWE